MSSKEYYSTKKRSSWSYTPMRRQLIKEIVKSKPDSVLEFGCGRGENLQILKGYGINVHGVEINADEAKIATENGIGKVLEGDESVLDSFVKNAFDVSFTCGVMDHIPEEEFYFALTSLEKITKNTIFCLETNDVPDKFYYPHDYKAVGFIKMAVFPQTIGDRSTYTLWRNDVSKI